MVNQSRPIINIETRKQFKSITQAAIYFELNPGSVSNVCNGLAFTARGFRFCFLDEYDPDNYKDDDFKLIESYTPSGKHFFTVERKRKYNSGKDHGKSRAVVEIESGRIFETVTQAARELGLKQCGISACLTGLQKTHKGKRFAYAKR